MRVIIFLAVIVLVLALVGWITFSKGPGGPSVTIESERIREDTKRAMDSSAQILHKAGDKVEAESNRDPNQAPNYPAPPNATR